MSIEPAHIEQTAPVDEVVIGISFRPIPSLMPSIIATIREQLKSNYPQLQYQPRLPDPNPFATTVVNPQQLFTSPQWPVTPAQDPFARIWLISSDDTDLIQIQADRLIANWRKRKSPYPGFSSVLEKFSSVYDMLIQASEQPEVQFESTLLEVAYFDWIPSGTISQSAALKFAEATQIEVDYATLTADPQDWNGNFTVNRDGHSPGRMLGQVKGNVMRINAQTPSVEVGSLVTWTCYLPLEPSAPKDILMSEIDFAKKLLRKAFDVSTTDQARQLWEISE